MNTPRSHHNCLYVYLLAMMGFSNIAIAAEQTYVREYVYQASEVDSKVSARAIALQEVKRELLSELGTHVSALVKQQISSNGTQLGTVEIETLSAGVTRVEILEEKWNGVVYVLKAQIKADPEDVLKSLHKMLDADKKQKQIAQLGGDLSKVQTEKIQIAESLTQSKKETTAALAEIAQLKKQLEGTQTEASRQTLQTAYQQQVEKLTLNELFESALKHYREGDYLVAFRLFKKAAEQGDAKAQTYLGWMYVDGDGVPKDVAKAFEWYQKAAAQGYAQAQYNLGWMYADGQGVPKNDAKALELYQKAAAQGYAEAQNNLGLIYYIGEDVPKDDAKAFELYQKAAAHGYAEAQFRLGLMYDIGKGVPRDDAKAFKWYQKAAAQGHAPAQNNLGLMYYIGDGVPRVPAKALELYQKAATQGHAEAQRRLGVMYAIGYGITRDRIRAYAWFNLASAQGDESAKTELAKLETLISPEQRTEAQRISAIWQKGDTFKNIRNIPDTQENISVQN